MDRINEERELLLKYTLFLKQYQNKKQEITISDKMIIEQFLNKNKMMMEDWNIGKEKRQRKEG